MTGLAFLETFDAEPQAPAEDVSVTDLPGYTEGFAAGEKAQQFHQETLRADLIEKLTEMSFGYAEAQKSILDSLDAFFDMLATKVLPDIVSDVQRAQIISALQASAQIDAVAPVTIIVPDGQINALTAALPDELPLPIEIVGSARLAEGEVLLSRAGGETSLNAQALIEMIQDILTSYPTPQSQEKAHG